MIVKGKLVSAEQLLEQCSRQVQASLRWLRTQTKAKAIPYIRLGHLVFFDLDMVRTALTNKNLVRGRFAIKRLLNAGHRSFIFLPAAVQPARASGG